MKDKRTYTNKKEHGEDMSHENESKIDTTPTSTFNRYNIEQTYGNTKKRESFVC